VPVLGTERGMSASAIGGILGLFALSVTAIRFVLPVVARRLSEATVLRAALLLAMLVFLIYPLAGAGWQMAACSCVLGVALGCAQPMVLTALHILTPRERQGEALALRSMTGNASSVLMPVAFGALGAALGAAGLFWSMSALLAGGSLLARTLSPRSSAPV
jgi:sugar phosphate permease